jgi:quercetin dioxygenase-like cupin family protein
MLIIWMRSYLVMAGTSTRSAPCASGEEQEVTMLRKKIILVVLLSLIGGTVMAQEAKVTPLMSKDLKDFAGKEGLLITVHYPPVSTDPIHRHNAHAFVYVLEGSIVMQLKGGKEVTLKPGETFYEGPDDVHIVGRSADKTKPAKFLVFLVKNKDAPVLVPVK